jgi:hypothetical protein
VHGQHHLFEHRVLLQPQFSADAVALFQIGAGAEAAVAVTGQHHHLIAGSVDIE